MGYAFADKYCTQDGAGVHDGSSWGNAWSFLEAAAGYSAGDHVHVRGEITTEDNVTLNTKATVDAPVLWEAEEGRVTVNVADNKAIFLANCDGCVFKDFDFTGSSSAGGVVYLNSPCVAYHCSFTNTTTTGNAGGFSAVVVGDEGQLFQCHVVLTGASDGSATGAVQLQNGMMLHTTVHTSITAVKVTATAIFNIVGCTLWHAGAVESDDRGIWLAGLVTGANQVGIYGNTVYGFYDGIHYDNGAGPAVAKQVFHITNNILYSLGRYGVYSETPDEYATLLLCSNAMGALGTGRTNLTAYHGEYDAVVLTADPFTDAGSGDFTLNDEAGGGTLCRAGAAPGAMLGGFTDYRDLGALQHRDVPPDYPAEGDVEEGVDYAYTEYTGTFVVPAEEDVERDVGYGEDGTEFTGTHPPLQDISLEESDIRIRTT